MNLLELIEEFQKIMANIANVTEETNTQVKQIPDVSIAEAPAKINAIFDLCAEGIKGFQEASAKAEEIQKVLGR